MSQPSGITSISANQHFSDGLLAKRRKRTDAEIKFLDCTINEANSLSISEEQLQTLRNALHNIKSESIGSACKSFIIKELPERQKIFNEIWSFRGKAAHQQVDRYELNEIASKAQHLASELIVKLVKKSL